MRKFHYDPDGWDEVSSSECDERETARKALETSPTVVLGDIALVIAITLAIALFLNLVAEFYAAS
jgi:hypothetical protein